jgi:fumarylacetoacetate (FAA) hydrolase
MKFITFKNLENEERLGVVVDHKILDLASASNEICVELPSDIISFLNGLPDTFSVAQEVEQAYQNGRIRTSLNQLDIKLLAPVPHPTSCRNAHAFRQHVATTRHNRGLHMIPEYDQFPVFHFINHNAVIGPGVLEVEQDHLNKLDFELELAIVVGKHGRNIPAKDADDYIFGLTIMNGFSARTLQMEEMRLNLGPAKSKDFATAIGPWLVTLDELERHKITTPNGRLYDMPMKAYHNGNLISQGNFKEMNWTFAEILERVSYGVDIFPGDIIGSGTVGSGCYLELNGTGTLKARERGENFSNTWLQEGDLIELEVAGLGKLRHKIELSSGSYSILEKKKM